MTKQQFSRAWVNGYANWHNGGMPFHIYAANEDIECVGCGFTIKKNRGLTLHKRGLKDPKLPKDHWKITAKPYCRKCYPFRTTSEIPPELRY